MLKFCQSRSDSVSKHINKCSVCLIMFKTKANKEIKKKISKKGAMWIGCDVEGCVYWWHAQCLHVDTSVSMNKMKKNCREFLSSNCVMFRLTVCKYQFHLSLYCN